MRAIPDKEVRWVFQNFIPSFVSVATLCHDKIFEAVIENSDDCFSHIGHVIQ